MDVLESNVTSDTSNWYFIICNCKIVCVNDRLVGLVRITAASLLDENCYKHYYSCFYHISSHTALMQDLWCGRTGWSVDMHIAVLFIDKRIILVILIRVFVVPLPFHGGA